MGITVLTPADDYLLTTVETVRAEGLLPDTVSDDIVQRRIAEASDYIRTYCGRSFAREEVEESLGAVGAPRIFLSLTPIIEITEVLFRDSPVTDYIIEDAQSGKLFREAGWTSTEMLWGGSISPHISPYQVPDWKFTYTGGFVLPGWAGKDPLPGGNGSDGLDQRTLPYDIERACLDVIKAVTNQAQVDSNVTRYRVGDTDVSFTREGGVLTPSTRAILDYHRRAF